MSKIPKGIFVTGTDTGVGKTVVTAAIAWNLTQAGKRVALMKPVQTGTIVSGPTDIEFVQKVLGANYSLDISCPYTFPDPVAPLVASMLAGERIDAKKKLGISLLRNSRIPREVANHNTLYIEPSFLSELQC